MSAPHNLSFGFSIFACVFVLLSSLRGWIVINAGIPAEFVYYTVAIVLLALSFYGFLSRYSFKGSLYISLRSLLMINLLLGLINIFVDMFFGQSIDASVFYIYLAPYFIFLISKVSRVRLDTVILLIALILSWSIIDNFLISIQGPEGQNLILEYNQKLRPELQSISRTGDFFRVGGYTGNPHDAANVMGICLIYLMLSFLSNKKISFLLGAIFSLFSLLLTQSAANIVLCASVLLFFVGLAMINIRKFKYIIPFIVLIILVFWAILLLGDFASIFIKRLDEDGDWSGMLKGLQSSDYIITILHLTFGHGTAFASEHMYTEVAFLKILLELGLFHWLILLAILIYPIIIYSKIKKKSFLLFTDVSPALGAILFGFISLLHYGSVFRVTSVFLFYTIYAIAVSVLDKYMKLNEFK